MKLIRFGNPGEEKPGLILEDNTWIDASDFGEDYNEEFFQNDGLKRLAVWVTEKRDTLATIDPSVRLAAPLARPSKIICIGLNFKKHVEECGAEMPAEPVIFFKATSAMVGPNDDLVIPKNSKQTDWEVELAVVIGKKASYVSKEEAMDYVAGYMLHNDYSEREFQLEKGGQWVKGKSCDTFSPLGPFLATTDEVSDVHNLKMWLKVNGESKQNSNTNDMVFDIPTLISYLSQFMSLLPGDIISCGTPEGVGLGFEPPQYLNAGDVVELGIEGLGESRQQVKAYGG